MGGEVAKGSSPSHSLASLGNPTARGVKYSARRMDSLSGEALDAALRAFLAEDVGAGDVTTLATTPASTRARGGFLTKSECVVSGLPVARRVFELLDTDVAWTDEVAAGTRVLPRTVLARLQGRARPILTA